MISLTSLNINLFSSLCRLLTLASSQQHILSQKDLRPLLSSFYDIPSISLRNAILPSIMRDNTFYVQWFAVDRDGVAERQVDGREEEERTARRGHDLSIAGPKAHQHASDLVIAYLDHQLCEMTQLENRYGAESGRVDWDAVGLRVGVVPAVCLLPTNRSCSRSAIIFCLSLG